MPPSISYTDPQTGEVLDTETVPNGATEEDKRLMAPTRSGEESNVPSDINTTQMSEESAVMLELVGDRLVIGRHFGIDGEGASLVEGLLATGEELDVLAQHYLSELYSMDVEERVLRSSSGVWERRPFINRRLDTIRAILGRERFERVTAETHKEWRKRFADADEKLGTCTACGEERAIDDLPRDDRLCGGCRGK